MNETLGIAGAGTIACGLAAVASRTTDVLLWARSEDSADRARTSVTNICTKLFEPDVNIARIDIVTDLEALGDASYLVEAVVEDHGSKAELLAQMGDHAREDAVLATTTSSLSISELARASGRPERFAGLHVFNPVPRMELVELVFPHDATEDTRTRSRELCVAMGKTPVEVPDVPGFVVNRLLFPYLFSAVELMAETGLSPEDIDRCMTLGAGLPMGPMALLDFVGLDVAQAIGESIGLAVPEPLTSLVRQGLLGKKSRRGFYDYG